MYIWANMGCVIRSPLVAGVGKLLAISLFNGEENQLFWCCNPQVVPFDGASFLYLRFVRRAECTRMHSGRNTSLMR